MGQFLQEVTVVADFFFDLIEVTGVKTVDHPVNAGLATVQETVVLVLLLGLKE